MTCLQLGGACNLEFRASTFEEITEMSKNHGSIMFQKGDVAHLKAMKKMKDLMNSPEKMKEWFEWKRKEFENSPDEDQISG